MPQIKDSIVNPIITDCCDECDDDDDGDDGDDGDDDDGGGGGGGGSKIFVHVNSSFLLISSNKISLSTNGS